MQLEMAGFDLFMRHTNTDGKSHVQQHRVWDKQRFLDARSADAAQLNAKEGSKKAKAEHITQDQYRKERK